MLSSVSSVSASNSFRQQVSSLLRVFQIVEREYNSRPPRSGSSDAYRLHRRVKDRDPYAFSKAYDSRVVKEPGFSNFIYEERMRSMGARAQLEVALPRQIYDYFLVLDFEATCDRDAPPHPQEIIEFPVLKVDSRTMKPVSQFHQYVSPSVNSELTPFCTQLTGIIQDMVDGQPQFSETLRRFDKWMETEGLLRPEVSSCFVTCGDWDLGMMLPNQANHFGVPLRPYFSKWINLKHAFSEAIGHYPRSMMLMLESLAIKHTGREHSGIDDCRNMMHIVQVLAQRGHVFRATGQVAPRSVLPKRLAPARNASSPEDFLITKHVSQS
ncbi:hypothetical protein RvY_14706 [Ramazzottius varieornatus]|uniref:Exonuclease domain-containing protein n=1 Tax=Ramazzottius varieornatus TaxID=947166 RepID=A0A1D1VTV7_RAMVA|nr:hypothetical protein RvY_14706 [Ramazzottius varieornatus]